MNQRLRFWQGKQSQYAPGTREYALCSVIVAYLASRYVVEQNEAPERSYDLNSDSVDLIDLSHKETKSRLVSNLYQLIP